MARRPTTSEGERTSAWRGLALRAVVLVVAGALVYLNSLSGPFIFDDRTAIIDNPQIRQLWPLSVPLSPPPDTPVAGRPIVNLTFAINYAIGGLDVTGYRLTNLAIHVLAGLTLFGVVRRTLRLPSLAPTFGEHATGLAWVVALLWTLHPMQTEVIDYVTQRTESMMGLCYLATIYCSVRALEGRPGTWHTAAILTCAAGMACKESMVTAPVMVFLYDRVFAPPSALQNVQRSRLYAGLVATWLILMALMLTGPRTSIGFDTPISAWTYLLNQAPVLLTYLRVAVWPRGLILDYGIPQPLTLTDVLVPMIGVVGLAVAVVVLLVRRPQAGFLGAWCFITLAPTSSFVPIATEVGADRRMYLPLVALVGLAVLGVYRLLIGRMQTRARVIGPAVALCLCIAFAVGTIQRNREYESLLSIAQTTVDRRPQPRAYLMLGTALLEAGRRDEGLAYLERARELPGTSFVLGIAFIAEGKLAAGAEELERFLRMEPKHLRAVDARESLGRAYAALNRLEPAAMHLTEVVQLEPRRGPAHAYLGEVLLRQGRVTEGLQQFQFASDLQPGNPDALRLLGIAQAQTGQFDAAVATFKRAIDLDPLNGRSHYLLGSALAASGQVAAAVPHFARAVELDPRDARAREDLQRAQGYVR